MSKYTEKHLSSLFSFFIHAFFLGSFFLVSGCDTLEDLIPDEIAFWEDDGGGGEEDTTRAINNPLLTSGILLDGRDSADSNQNSLTAFIIDPIPPNTLNTINTETTSIVNIDPVANRIAVGGDSLTFTTSNESPIGRGSRTVAEWGKLRNFESLYYRSRSNNAQRTTGFNYVEYHALSYIVPLTPDEQTTQVLNEIVRAHMVLRNDPAPTGPYATDIVDYSNQNNVIVFPAYDADRSNFNEDNYGLYQYSVGYGLWYGENAQATGAETLNISGTAQYVGAFLGRQRVELVVNSENIQGAGVSQEQSLVAIAREKETPVIRFDVDFGTPSSFTFTIESTELSIINQGATGSMDIELSGQGNVTAGEVSGAIETARIQVSVISAVDTVNSRFNVEEFPTDSAQNSLIGHFYKNGADFNAALAGTLFAQHSLTRGIYEITYNIDGVFLAEKESEAEAEE